MALAGQIHVKIGHRGLDILKRKTAKLKQTQESLKAAEQFSKTVLNSLSAHIAILDQDSVIIDTNQAWRNFAKENGINMSPDTIGVNYLQICDSAQGESSEGSREAAEGIRSIINGEIDELSIDYPCHSPDKKRWFYMRVNPVKETDLLRIVVSHEDITPIKRIEQVLKNRELELERKNRDLEEANIAFKVLLIHREKDKSQLEETVLVNVKNMIQPYLSKLRKMETDSSKIYTSTLLNPTLKRSFPRFPAHFPENSST